MVVRSPQTIQIGGQEIELTLDLIQFYLRETSRRVVKKRAVEKFFNNLVDQFLLIDKWNKSKMQTVVNPFSYINPILMVVLESVHQHR